MSKYFRICRSTGLLLAGFLLLGISAAVAQSSGSNSDKLPPPPTIDVNVNQNDTLTAVRYDNRYEVYGGFAFSHFKAGPSLAEGANLGGFDIQGTRWLTGRLGATANVRGYYGTQGPAPKGFNVHGPFVMEHLFMGGATYRLIAKEHAALSAHGMVGGAYGSFGQALPMGVVPRDVGLYNSGLSFAASAGGSLDLNRSPRLALRISPDWILTRYSGYGTPQHPVLIPSKLVTNDQSEFGLSVGIIYRFDLGKGPRFH